MWHRLLGMVCLTLFAGLHGVLPAEENESQPKAKLRAVEREEPYVKAEVRGALRHEVFSSGASRWEGWTITAGTFKWELDFGTNKEFLEAAKENNGKVVVVTGKLETRPATLPAFQTGFGQTTVLVVATFKATEK